MIFDKGNHYEGTNESNQHHSIVGVLNYLLRSSSASFNTNAGTHIHTNANRFALTN